ncbi:MAG: ATP-dependent DNA helicase RecG, partial [Verrucomicrobia bacterium]|nr:ATP-dependent DNA helicase RecG [Cytophagales bacterium]
MNTTINANFFETKIEFLKGVGPQKAATLNKELEIFTFADLIQYYPFRHEDRSQLHKIADLSEEIQFIQLRGRIREFARLGEGHKKRLVGYFFDGSGDMELVWFNSIEWIVKNIKESTEYLVFGRPTLFNKRYSISHPEISEFSSEEFEKNAGLQPVYNLTESLRKKFIDSKALGKMIRQVLELAGEHIRETLPDYLITEHELASKAFAVQNIHFPKDWSDLEKATQRLKFEELFYSQLKILKNKVANKIEHRGLYFNQIPSVKTFYEKHLPFDLTNAQKRVIKEIYKDLTSGKQMNRLLQGDVGSGKTIVAFIIMLMA